VHGGQFRGFRQLFLDAGFAAEPGRNVVAIVPTGESPKAQCPNTRLTIPECSCSRCLEEQIRRVAPALLEREVRAPALSDPVPITVRRGARLA